MPATPAISERLRRRLLYGAISGLRFRRTGLASPSSGRGRDRKASRGNRQTVVALTRMTGNQSVTVICGPAWDEIEENGKRNADSEVRTKARRRQGRKSDVRCQMSGQRLGQRSDVRCSRMEPLGSERHEPGPEGERAGAGESTRGAGRPAGRWSDPRGKRVSGTGRTRIKVEHGSSGTREG